MGNKFSCNNPTITLANAEDVKNLVSCTAFAGNVLISYGGDLNLGTKLSSIGGTVTCVSSSATQSIVGNSLQSIGGDFVLTNSPALGRVALPNLKHIGGRVEISNLPQFSVVNSSLFGTQSLSTIDGNMIIRDNKNLQTLYMPGLTTIKGGLSCVGASATVSIEANLLQLVGGDLILTDSSVLGRVSLSALNKIGGNLQLRNLPRLSILNAPLFGTQSLSTIGGSVVITDNNNLQTLYMPNLTAITGGMTCAGGASMVSITAGSLTSVGGDLVVTQSSGLTHLALPSLNRVGGRFELSSLSKMPAANSSFLNVSSLQVVGGDCSLTDSPALDRVSLPSLTRVGGKLELRALSQASATELPFLNASSLQSIDGDWTFTDCSARNQVLLPNLNHIGGKFKIRNVLQFSTTNLSFFDVSSLQSIDGDCSITDSSALGRLILPNLNRIGGKLELRNVSQASNVNLSFLDAQSLQSIGGNCSLTSSPLFGQVVLPSLNRIGGALELRNLVFRETNSSLVDVRMLDSIGSDMIVKDNTNLKALFMPNLTTVKGSIKISGFFSSLSLPLLATVLQHSEIDTGSGNASICQRINELNTRGVFHGGVNCYPQHGLQKDDRIALIVASVLGAFCLLSSMLWMNLTYPRRKGSSATTAYTPAPVIAGNSPATAQSNEEMTHGESVPPPYAQA